MPEETKSLERTFVVLGIVTLLGMWVNVGLYLLYWGGPFQFAYELVRNPAVLMLSIEMACMAVVASIIMCRDAERYRLGNGLTLVVAGIVAGFGAVFPLFLAARERRLRRE